jgi:hypothetical protein
VNSIGRIREFEKFVGGLEQLFCLLWSGGCLARLNWVAGEGSETGQRLDRQSLIAEFEILRNKRGDREVVVVVLSKAIITHLNPLLSLIETFHIDSF